MQSSGHTVGMQESVQLETSDTDVTNASDTAGEIVVRLRNLRKRYGNREIVRGVDLDIAAGETYALLGPNGAGKSTTIEILEGLRRPDSGTVSVLGENPLSAPRSWREHIGIVSQSTGEFGQFTPRELLKHFAGFYRQPRAVDEVLELVGLSTQAQVRASKLSGGQQRRLDVALGVIGKPKLLFLDEPTTGFDPEARRHFWRMLKSLAQEGTAILLTTHYLDEAAYLADRVGVLSDGVLVAEAPPAELGGAAARTPIIRWVDGAGVLHEERTLQPGKRVIELYAEYGGEPKGLEVMRPSLEETYLELIGVTEAGADTGSEVQE